jgi:hypothetical protein
MIFVEYEESYRIPFEMSNGISNYQIPIDALKIVALVSSDFSEIWVSDNRCRLLILSYSVLSSLPLLRYMPPPLGRPKSGTIAGQNDQAKKKGLPHLSSNPFI